MADRNASDQAVERPDYPVESVDRALLLLLMFEEADAISVAEASSYLEVSRSTSYRLLKMLQYRGFVRQDPRTKAYIGGPALLRVGLAAVGQLDVREAARPLLETVVKELDETAHLVVLQRADAFFLDCVESTKAIRATPRTGTSLPAHCTAGGKALLAQLRPPRLDALLSGAKLATLTPRSLQSIRKLKDELAVIRRRGYSINDGESEIGLRAVAAVLAPRDLRLSVDAAITISGPQARLSNDRLVEVAEVLLAHCTHEIAA